MEERGKGANRTVAGAGAVSDRWAVRSKPLHPGQRGTFANNVRVVRMIMCRKLKKVKAINTRR